MRLDRPRIEPLKDEEFTEEHKDALGYFLKQGWVLNIFRTLVRAPRAFKRFNVWGGYVLSERNDLPPRERELIILRTGWLCKAGYEWGQHVEIGRDCGLTDAEIERIKQGPDTPEWTPLERALLQATDELVTDHFITDATWQALSELTEKQRMDVVFTVGQYTQVSMILNSFGIQLDAGMELDPDLRKR
ncbi:MAG: carboxymuconolactone decarboxylase [Rhizobiales bacterium NRL2]|jgi:alkylhydroperoxidase family enzyme|nr:MAG: carboxymuconolactone decarboxylase [Rhizobiales bacterium NRL2]